MVEPARSCDVGEPVDSLEYLGRTRRLLERALRQRRADGTAERLIGAIGAVADYDYARGTPLGDLVTMLRLQPTEADMIAVLLACETEPACARLASQLIGASSPAITVEVLYEIAYRPRGARDGHAAALLHSDLAPDGLLRRLRFIIIDGADTRPFLSQTVRPSQRLVAWLLGRRELDADLAAHARLRPPAPPRATCETDAVTSVTRAFEARDRVVALHGPTGSGRELVLRAASHRLERPLLIVNGRGLALDRIVTAFREATLHDAMLGFRDAGELFESAEARQRLRECLHVYPQTVALLGLAESSEGVAGARTMIDVRVRVPDHASRLALWRTHARGETALTESQWRELGGLYNLGVGGIVEACDVARSLADSEHDVLSRGHLARAVRQLFDRDLAAVAKRTDVTQTWDDVVLPDDVIESVTGVVDRIAFRNEVFGQWGFGRKVGKGLGLTVLFSGQPGTGKSMVAGLIARQLGLDLYVINLSRIMSKWIGETEKNLDRAFDAAEAGHVMLLFDEADTILGKRTADVKSSNDRHANLETNFILARLEQFQGVAVFTTNISSAIDPAVLRRMSVNITFPFPDADARAELWRRMLPAEAPVAPGIDFAGLARRFELSGGFIRNVVLRAAFLAAREGAPIQQTHLERAARSEYGDRGALTAGGRLG